MYNDVRISTLIFRLRDRNSTDGTLTYINISDDGQIRNCNADIDKKSFNRSMYTVRFNQSKITVLKVSASGMNMGENYCTRNLSIAKNTTGT